VGAPPREVTEAMRGGFTDGELGSALRGTLTTLLAGYVISATLGALLATTSRGSHTIEPLVDGPYAPPMSLLIPGHRYLHRA
jgi:ABC-type nitrate/sulfonate/bicarbonate transport system permease component